MHRLHGRLLPRAGGRDAQHLLRYRQHPQAGSRGRTGRAGCWGQSRFLPLNEPRREACGGDPRQPPGWAARHRQLHDSHAGPRRSVLWGLVQPCGAGGSSAPAGAGWLCLQRTGPGASARLRGPVVWLRMGQQRPCSVAPGACEKGSPPPLPWCGKGGPPTRLSEGSPAVVPGLLREFRDVPVRSQMEPSQLGWNASPSSWGGPHPAHEAASA